jgi:hypothetical protein
MRGVIFRRRIASGHALVGIGVLVRRLAHPAALLAFLALVLAGFTPAGAAVGTGLVFGTPAVILAAGRLVAVGLGALGWILFPREHRAMLSDIADRAQLRP